MSEHPHPADGPVPAPRPGPATPGAEDTADQVLGAVLTRLDGLGAMEVHDHVEVYAAVDEALRRRLAGAEG